MEGVRNLWESQRGLMLLVGLSMVAISLVVVSGGLKGSGEDMTMTGDCWFVPSVEPTETYHLEIPDEEACGPCEFSSLKRSELERDEHGVPRWQLEVHCKSPSSRPRYRFSIINVDTEWHMYHGTPVLVPRHAEAVAVKCDAEHVKYSERACPNDSNFHVINQFNASLYAERAAVYEEYKQKLPESGSRELVKAPNIIMLMFDSASRDHAYRRIPDSIAKMQELSRSSSVRATFFDFERFNAVGLNSPANFLGFLTGRVHADAWHTESWLYPILRMFTGDRQTTSPYKTQLRAVGAFIWDILHDAGYVTLFSEGLCFDKTLRVLGFTWNIKETFDIGLFGWYPFRYPENTPPKAGVDYYMQDAWCAFDNKLVTIYDGFRRSQHPPKCVCLGNKFASNHALEYVTQFHDHYDGLPRFTFYAFQEAHERRMQIFGSVDEGLSEFLSAIAKPREGPSSFDEDGFERLPQRASSLLEESIVLVFGDHGLNFGDFVFNTHQGWVEHKNPMLFMSFPDKFLAANPRYRKALEVNQKRLVTSYDLFSTLVDAALYPRRRQPPNPRHSQSLFEEVPADRSCEDALIPDLYCMEKVVSKEVCWSGATECELPAERDRQQFVWNLLATQTGEDVEHAIHTIPSADFIYWARWRQHILDVLVLVLLGCILFAAYLVYDRYRGNVRKERAAISTPEHYASSGELRDTETASGPKRRAVVEKFN